MKLRMGLTIYLVLLLSVVFCFAEPTNYTATMVMDKMQSNYARDGKKIRTEMDMGDMGKMISIVRTDVKKNIMLNPASKMYFENVWEESKMQSDPAIFGNDANYKVDKVKVGSETIDKHPCIKYTLTVTNKQTGEKQTGTIWEATDLQNLLIKYEMVHNNKKMTMEWKNVKLNAATTDMFDVPAGYKKASSMMELMGMGGMGMPGMQRGMDQHRQQQTDEAEDSGE
ncbi:MAG: DUF4412 domain-containing protein [bacterium]|nr:DUF4412 domain-containing protein [bacterium]